MGRQTCVLAGLIALLTVAVASADWSQPSRNHSDVLVFDHLSFEANSRPSAHPDARLKPDAATRPSKSRPPRSLTAMVGMGIAVSALLVIVHPHGLDVPPTVATQQKLHVTLVAMDALALSYCLLATLLMASDCVDSDQCTGLAARAPILVCVYVISTFQMIGIIDGTDDDPRDATLAAAAFHGPVHLRLRRAAADPGRENVRLDPIGCDKYMDAMASLAVFVFPSIGLGQGEARERFPEAYISRLHVVYAVQLCVFTTLLSAPGPQAADVLVDTDRQSTLVAWILTILWFARAGTLGALTELHTHVRRNPWSLHDL